MHHHICRGPVMVNCMHATTALPKLAAWLPVVHLTSEAGGAIWQLHAAGPCAVAAVLQWRSSHGRGQTDTVGHHPNCGGSRARGIGAGLPCLCFLSSLCLDAEGARSVNARGAAECADGACEFDQQPGVCIRRRCSNTPRMHTALYDPEFVSAEPAIACSTRLVFQVYRHGTA
jgi:hypothetical protein